MHGPVEEVARSVTGEHPSRPVGSVRGRRQAEHQDGRPRITETGHATAPVLLFAKRGALLVGDVLTPGDQARAAPAVTDVGGQVKERIHRLHTKLQPRDGESETSTPIVDAVLAGAPWTDPDDWKDPARARSGFAPGRHGPVSSQCCRRADCRVDP